MGTSLRDTGAIEVEESFLPESEVLFAELVKSITWDQRIRARKAASFGLPYNYSGITWPAAPFPELLLPVLGRVADRVGWQPNNCLAHYYPDSGSTMGFHSEATDELEPPTGIAVVSLGAERGITFRHQSDKQRLEHYRLPSGSLLHMSPEMQAEWKHAILAEEDLRAGRVSLTFRRMRAPQLAE